MSIKVFLLTLSTIFSAISHEYYLSVSTIRFTESDLQIEIRVFKDDLEKVLDDDFENLEKNSLKVYVYFEKHFQLYDDQKSLRIFFKEIKDKGDAVLIFGTVSSSFINRLKVKNTIFLEKFSAQKNVVHIYRNDKIKTTVLDARNAEYTLP
ncbi:MAG: DUF6702 family protein [Thermaurantimonas sp.]|uniref:DUF6702 family protein n=1 Tax=Thermaurantimonas sp. TaxID=2681568 RepID=UPI00391CF972